MSTPRRLQPGQLVEQHAGVDDHAVADHVLHAGREDPGRDEVQGEVLAVGQHHGVPGVVAALVAHHPLHLARRAGRWPCPCPRRPTGRRSARSPACDTPVLGFYGAPVRRGARQGRVTDHVGHDDSSVVLLTCVVIRRDARRRPCAVSPQVACPPRRSWPPCSCPARPGRADLRPGARRARPARRRASSRGTDADLAAVLRAAAAHRAARRRGGLPARARPPAGGGGWGLPTGAAAVELAPHGPRAARRRWSATTAAACWWAAGRSATDRARRVLLRRDAGAARVGAAAGRDAPGRRRRRRVRDRRAAPPASPCGRAAGARSRRPLRPVPPAARAGRGAAVGRAVQVGCAPATVVARRRAAPAAGHPLGLVPARRPTGCSSGPDAPGALNRVQRAATSRSRPASPRG